MIDLKPRDRIGNRYLIEEAIDDIPGFTARVYGVQPLLNDTGSSLALKTLKPKHMSDENDEQFIIDRYESFNREAELLEIFADEPRVVNLFEVGYLYQDESDGPQDYHVVDDLEALDMEHFRSLQSTAIENGWAPYLIIERHPRKNLLQHLLSRQSQKSGRWVRLPMIEAVDLTLQLADLLVKLHNNNIVYLDAKPAHLCWDGERLVIIDWNVSYALTQENLKSLRANSPEELKKEDLLNNGCDFIYPAFVGRDPGGNDLESQPIQDGGMARSRHTNSHGQVVEFYGYERWLDQPILDFLTAAVQGEFQSAHELQSALQHSAAKLGWQFDDVSTPAENARSLEQKRQLVGRLRTLHGDLKDILSQARELRQQFPGEDTDYLYRQAHRLHKQSDIPD